jgi:hypothetical protein
MIVLVGLLSVPQASAQSGSGSGSPLEVKNSLGTILLMGLAGGLVGLSTLSFYDKPQDNIRNIFFGAGAGMIIATFATTFAVATTPVPVSRLDWSLVPYVASHNSESRAGAFFQYAF